MYHFGPKLNAVELACENKQICCVNYAQKQNNRADGEATLTSFASKHERVFEDEQIWKLQVRFFLFFLKKKGS